MKTITSQLTKKRITLLAALCSAGLFLTACEPTAEQQSAEPLTPSEQDSSTTYGQPNRDLQEDPAMQDSTTGSVETTPAPVENNPADAAANDSADTAF